LTSLKQLFERLRIEQLVFQCATIVCAASHSRAMVAAANFDGQILQEERRRILAQLD